MKYCLVIWNFFFPFSWECHHPNWRTQPGSGWWISASFFYGEGPESPHFLWLLVTGTWLDSFPIQLKNGIIPTDVHILQKGRAHPPTSIAPWCVCFLFWMLIYFQKLDLPGISIETSSKPVVFLQKAEEDPGWKVPWNPKKQREKLCPLVN